MQGSSCEKNRDPSGRFTRLIKYTTGEAKDLIKHRIQQPLSEGYRNALVLLRIRYSNPLKVLPTYRKEIRRWPTIKAGDASSFRSFHNFLLKCQSVTSNQTWNALDSPDTLCLMIAKFPRHIRDRWNRQVLTIRKRRSREPSLADLIAFVEEETLLVDDPLFSNNAVEQYLDRTDKSSKRGSTKYFVTLTEEKDNQKQVQSRCPMCQKVHDLDACYSYKKLEVGDRKKFLMKQKLCFGCYETISKDHNGRNCPRRRICCVCNENHPTGLHGHKPKNKESVAGGSQSSEEKSTDSRRKIACASTTIQEDVISMCVVPVKVKHKDSNFVHSTFAMLDNCSQGCFVKASLMKTLRIGDHKTSITVKTLTGEENHTTFALEGLRVCIQLSLNQKWISLPKAYTKEDLPVDSWEVATARKLKKWKHPSGVTDEVIKDDRNINVELLIGASCTRALDPIKVIPSRNDGPSAMKTVLGWCIVGPISYRNQSEGKIPCNPTAVMEAGSNKVSRHYFAAENKLTPDDHVKSMLKKIFEQEFTGPNMRFTSVIGETTGDMSCDDQIFLRLTN